MKWASDANAFVCTVVMPDGVAALQTGDLYPTYYNSVIGTIELQIAKGGYRLANWLNLIAAASDGPIESRAIREPVIKEGRSGILPAPRPLSKAKMARAAAGGSCLHPRHSHE